MRTGSNVRLRSDGRWEARYIKSRDDQGKIQYGYCYGKTMDEAIAKRERLLPASKSIKRLNLLILGAGSHGQEVKELAQTLRVFHKISFLDDHLSDVAIGPCCDFSVYVDEYPVAIPAVGDTALRMQWMRSLIEAGFVIPTLIHPTASVSPSAVVGDGTVICAGATIATGVKMGIGTIVSSAATIDRNVDLPDWSYVDCGETVRK